MHQFSQWESSHIHNKNDSSSSSKLYNPTSRNDLWWTEGQRRSVTGHTVERDEYGFKYLHIFLHSLDGNYSPNIWLSVWNQTLFSLVVSNALDFVFADKNDAFRAQVAPDTALRCLKMMLSPLLRELLWDSVGHKPEEAMKVNKPKNKQTRF